MVVSPLTPDPSVVHRTNASQREALRQVIADLERDNGGNGRPRLVATGFQAIDQELPDGGLALGAVHEIAGPLAHGFAARILAHLSGPVLWFRPQTEKALLYAPTLQALGCRVEHWLIAYTPTPKDLLWGLEEGLRSGAVDAVIGEPSTPLSMTASRRLQLAAERGKALGLILTGRHHVGGNADTSQRNSRESIGQLSPSESIGQLSPSTLTSRWHVSPILPPVPTQHATSPDIENLWRVRLLKHRNANAASWLVPTQPSKGVR